MNLNERLNASKNQVFQLARKYGATNLRVFGSVARGEATSQSDIDLLVRFDPNRSLLDHVGLVQDLEALLGCEVDVVSEKGLHWYVRDKILKEARPL